MSNLNLEHWFPTTIGYIDCPFLKDIYDSYGNEIKSIQFDEAGFSYTQIHLDDDFKKLNNWITDNVNQYAKAHKFPDLYVAKESWVMNYKKGGGQPWHTHAGSTISTIFYFDVNENDTGTKFRSPTYNDILNPLNISPVDDEKSDKYNELTFPTCTYNPVQGRLLIFRSYLEHSVKNKTNDDKRIIFSYNYGPKK